MQTKSQKQICKKVVVCSILEKLLCEQDILLCMRKSFVVAKKNVKIFIWLIGHFEMSLIAKYAVFGAFSAKNQIQMRLTQPNQEKLSPFKAEL